MLMMLLGLVSGPSDTELVRKFKAGDRHAYEEIVRRYQSRIFTLCLRWLNHRTIAEEVAQDVFLAVYKALGEFRGESLLSTWIYRIAINHCKNRRLYRFRRAEDRHESLDAPQWEDGPTRQVASLDPGTDASSQQDDAAALVYEGLAQLDEEQRAIIMMRDIQDLSYEDIADILDVPRGTVKSRLHRARAELARILSKKISTEDVF